IPARGTNTDTDIWGGELSTDKIIPLGNLALTYYTRQIKSTKVAPSTGNNTLSVATLRAGGDIIAGLGYTAEYLQDLGRNNTVAGTPAYDGTAYFLGVHYGHMYD